MKDSTGLTIIMIVLALILCGVVWQGVRIEELYKNYRWMYEKQSELIYNMNNMSKSLGLLCIKDIENGGTNWTFDPNDPNRILFISGSIDPNKGEKE